MPDQMGYETNAEQSAREQAVAAWQKEHRANLADVQRYHDLLAVAVDHPGRFPESTLDEWQYQLDHAVGQLYTLKNGPWYTVAAE